MIFAFRSYYQKTKVLYQRYERVLIPAMLVFGFVMDYVTFKKIQPSTALTVLAFYFLIAGASIVFIQYYDCEKISQRFRFFRLFAPLVVQFTFGALLGATFIFYWFSASVAVSWPFIIIILLMILSNELLKDHFKKPIVQVSVYYFISFSFLSIVVPYIFNGIGARLFMLAAVSSLVFVYGYVYVLSRLRSVTYQRKRILWRIVFVIFFTMNALYFANIIPPVPLSLREVGVYHNVSRSGGRYILEQEKKSFWEKIIPGQTIHANLGNRIYVYTAIFSPPDFNTRIYHHWEYYDENEGEWEERDRLSFNITGGREAGYRGYSSKSSVNFGKWRVITKTETGQSLGRTSFRVKNIEDEREIEKLIR